MDRGAKGGAVEGRHREEVEAIEAGADVARYLWVEQLRRAPTWCRGGGWSS